MTRRPWLAPLALLLATAPALATAPPPPQPGWTRPVGAYVFVMKPLGGAPGETEDFPASGLYRRGSTEPLWTLQHDYPAGLDVRVPAGDRVLQLRGGLFPVRYAIPSGRRLLPWAVVWLVGALLLAFDLYRLQTAPPGPPGEGYILGWPRIPGLLTLLSQAALVALLIALASPG